MPYIPPLTALRSLEAVLRLGSFGRAAEELNVSKSAISHQVKALEENLGVALVVRPSTGETRRTTATPEGRRLQEAVELALGQLGNVCEDIKAGSRKTKRRRLIVSANGSFSSLWLAPRIASFAALQPGVEVHVRAVEAAPNLETERIDLAVIRIRRATELPTDEFLTGERVFPVASPVLLKDQPSGLADPADLMKFPLLQEEHSGTPEIDWSTWFDRLGLGPVPSERITRFSGFNLAVGAAIAGGGIALGRSPLIDFEMASGRLVRVLPGLEQPGSWNFVLRYNRQSRIDPIVRKLVVFLHQQADASRKWTADT